VAGMLIGSLLTGPAIGGYYSPYPEPYYARPYYARPAWEPGWFSRGPPRPWWSYEGYHSDEGPPMEIWPVAVFDVARSRACRAFNGDRTQRPNVLSARYSRCLLTRR
jgi:hypothetical protein